MNQEVITGLMVEYKCVLITHGVQYVIIIGMKRMLVLYVDNLDMHQKVESNFSNDLIISSEMDII